MTGEPVSSSSTRLPSGRSKLAVTWRIMPTAVRVPVTSSVRCGVPARQRYPIPGRGPPNSWCSPAGCQGSSSSACSRRPRASLPDVASCRAPGRAVASIEGWPRVEDPDGLRHGAERTSERLGSAPELLAGQAGTFGEGPKLGPLDRGVYPDLVPSLAEPAVAASDHVLAPDEPGKVLDSRCH